MDEQEFFHCVDDALGYPLSKDQQDAIIVNSNADVTQIVAGPGAGKTEVLALRIIYEIMVRGIESHRIMATTFTNKSAEELTYRIAIRTEQIIERAKKYGFQFNDPKVQLLRVGTMHALCDQLLNELDPYVEAGLQLVDESNAQMRLMRHSPQLKNLVRKRMERLVGDLLTKRKTSGAFSPGVGRFELATRGRKQLSEGEVGSRCHFFDDGDFNPEGCDGQRKNNGLDPQTPSGLTIPPTSISYEMVGLKS